MDPKTSWTQVAKSGQMKATSTSAATSTSGSSFAGAAAGGAWASSGAAGGGAWASSRPISGPLTPCRLPGLHGLHRSQCHKDRGRRHGSLPEPMSGPLTLCRLNCLHRRHPNPNRHPIPTWNLHRRQLCDKHRRFHRCGHRPQLIKSQKKINK